MCFGSLILELKFINGDNNYALAANTWTLDIYDCSEALEVSDGGRAIPTTTTLLTAYPNPFNSTTNISFQIPSPGSVKLELFNISGRLIDDVSPVRIMTSGSHVVSWNAGNVPAGCYFLKFKAGDETHITPLLLVK